MGLDLVSGQYEYLFSRCRKYVINSLIHGHFHTRLIIIPRPILALDSVSGQYGVLGMITRPIWKCPCINLYIFLLIFKKKFLFLFVCFILFNFLLFFLFYFFSWCFSLFLFYISFFHYRHLYIRINRMNMTEIYVYQCICYSKFVKLVIM
jgi:hypothetical protein